MSVKVELKGKAVVNEVVLSTEAYVVVQVMQVVQVLQAVKDMKDFVLYICADLRDLRETGFGV